MKFKKFFKAVLCITLLLSCVLFTTSCTNKPENSVKDGKVAVALGENGVYTLYTVKLSELKEDAKVIDLFNYLHENKGLNMVSGTGEYGAYVTELGTLREGGGKYLYFYTTVKKDADTSAYAKTLTELGITLYSSGLGVGSMNLENGAVIFVTYITY